MIIPLSIIGGLGCPPFLYALVTSQEKAAMLIAGCYGAKSPMSIRDKQKAKFRKDKSK